MSGSSYKFRMAMLLTGLTGASNEEVNILYVEP